MTKASTKNVSSFYQGNLKEDLVSISRCKHKNVLETIGKKIGFGYAQHVLQILWAKSLDARGRRKEGALLPVEIYSFVSEHTGNSFDLKMCPFCNSKPIVSYAGNDHTPDRKVKVRCPSCCVSRSSGTRVVGLSELEVIAFDLWNERV